MICGYCAIGKHEKCDGLCRATYAFCACADRKHQHPALQKPDPKPLRAVVRMGEDA